MRLATVAAVGVSALAVAGNAFATPKLTISQSNTSFTLTVTQTANDPPPARVRIFVPAGYTVNTSQAVNTNLGAAEGQVFSRDQNIPLPLAGNVVVDDPAKHTKDACSPGTNQAVWLLRLTVVGQTIELPVYVNPTTGAETTLGSVTLTICLPPPDVPQGTPGRAPFGTQLLLAKFTLNGVFTPPVGATRWTSLWTPYAAGTGVPNAAGTVEARAFVGPGAVTISGRVTNKRRHIVSVRGRVSYAGIGLVAATVRLMIDGKVPRGGSGTTHANGAYGFRLQRSPGVKVKTHFFQVRAISTERDVTTTGCATPSVPGVACVSATQGAFEVLSRKIKIRV